MLVQGDPGRNNASLRAAMGVFLVVGVLTRAIEPILLAWTGENPWESVHASLGAGSRRAPDLAGGLRGRRAKTQRRGEAQREYKQIQVPFWTGQ